MMHVALNVHVYGVTISFRCIGREQHSINGAIFVALNNEDDTTVKR